MTAATTVPTATGGGRAGGGDAHSGAARVRATLERAERPIALPRVGHGSTEVNGMRGRTVRAVGVAGVVLVAVVVLSGCEEPRQSGEERSPDPVTSEPVDGSSGTAPSPEALADLRDYGNLEVPSSATDLDVRTQSGLDFTVFARWVMPRDELAGFLDDAGFAVRDGFDVIGPTPLWDDPAEQFEAFAGGSDMTPERFRKITVGLDMPDRVVVLVVAGSW